MPKGIPITPEFVADVRRGIERAGNQSALAEKIGKSPAAVNGWVGGRIDRVTRKSVTQLAEYLASSETPVTPEPDPAPERPGSLVGRVPVRLVPADPDMHFASWVVGEFQAALKRQGTLTLWQLKIMHKAEQMLGYRNERNEPIDKEIGR